MAFNGCRGSKSGLFMLGPQALHQLSYLVSPSDYVCEALDMSLSFTWLLYVAYMLSNITLSSQSTYSHYISEIFYNMYDLMVLIAKVPPQKQSFPSSYLSVIWCRSLNFCNIFLCLCSFSLLPRAISLFPFQK